MEHVAEFSRKAQCPGGAGGARVRRGRVAFLPRFAGRYGHKPGDFTSCFLPPSLPGTPLSSHQGTFKRLRLDTTIKEAVEISAED